MHTQHYRHHQDDMKHLKLRNPNEKNLYLLYSIMTAGFGNQKKSQPICCRRNRRHNSPPNRHKNQEFTYHLKKKRALAKIDEERNNQ